MLMRRKLWAMLALLVATLAVAQVYRRGVFEGLLMTSAVLLIAIPLGGMLGLLKRRITR
jgi:hypothetical protein